MPSFRLGQGLSTQIIQSLKESSSKPLITNLIGDLVEINTAKDPTVINSEEGMLTAYVYIDFSGRDIGSYVNEAKKKATSVKIPNGFRLLWSGEYEYLE